MKTITCRNIDKLVAHHNRQISKLDNSPCSELTIQSILGTNSQEIKGSVTFALSGQEVIYYSSEYFIAHNLLTKQNIVIKKEGCHSHKTIYIEHFETALKEKLILTIEKSASGYHVGQLYISGNITEGADRSSQNKLANVRWKISKLTNKTSYSIQHLSYHANKHYLYLLVSRKGQQKLERNLWVYDLNRECLLMSPQIKPSIPKVDICSIWITEQPSQIYFIGKNYFRFWTINFNQKNLKESNYRNIQRCLSNKKIIKMFYCYSQNIRLLAVLTETHLILLKRNQLVSCEKPPTNSIKKAKSKDNIEAELENSLNQIYRMKFMFDDQENQNKILEEFQTTPENLEQQQNNFFCASQIWSGDEGDFISIATKIGNLLTYSINNGQMKLMSELIVRKNHSFDHMTVSKKGEVILLSQKHCQNVYIINKYSLNSQETQEQLKQFWGAGHINKENIASIDSPSLHQRVCTLGENSTLKIWSFKGKQRKIQFQQKMTSQPTQLSMHPCGLLLAINYAKQIKLMSILPTGLYEVMSAKTNYNSIGLKYSECGNFLVSNEQNLLMFYNPFTLKTMGYIQPSELKSTIIDFFITPEASQIVYLTSDFSLYIMILDLNSYKYLNIQPSHIQKQQYTCFYFQTGINNNTKNLGEKELEDLFIGCTQHKYMVLYKDFGKNLITQFPIEDCYITNLCVADGWLFTSTSKGSLRVYKWPILESDCQMEIINLEQRTIKFKPPRYEQYFFWSDEKKILKIHKLGFSNKLVITRQGGIMSVLCYNKQQNQKSEETSQRKKLGQIVNDTFYMTKNQSEKRNRLIEKTEGDILKVQNEIAKEKCIMERKYKQQCNQIEKTFQQKHEIQQQQKNEYLTKIRSQINNLKSLIQLKKKSFNKQTQSTIKTYDNKRGFEQSQNLNIQNQINSIIKNHKLRIANMMENQKEQIRSFKNNYRQKIINMKNDFQGTISDQYPSLMTKQNIGDKQQRKIANQPRTSIQVAKGKENGVIEEFQEEQEINILNEKVEDVKLNNDELKYQLEEIKFKVKFASVEDERLQKDFQKCLEEYNSNRFSNLGLHSQVLKMRTQLVQRKEIMSNKQDIINMAFQQRQKLENYKELVRGTLTKFQDRKEQTYKSFTNKQNQLAFIYQELSANAVNYEQIKREQKRVESLLKVLGAEKDKRTSEVENSIVKLKEIKRYLLLQGLTQDAEQKKLYVEQQNLLTTINFYKKRMSMEFLKQKKNKVLKKSALNLVLKQNKNLLEECNQLRGETIEYQHEIKNLGKKLGQANKIISIETKLFGQKQEVDQQRNQLEAIRAMFNQQIVTFDEQYPSQIM